MVTKEVELANAALLLLGANRISSLEEESTEAIAVHQFYERSYRALLGIFPWNFAMKIQELADLNTTPLDEENKYTYALPSDFLWIQRVIPNQESYKILGNKLYSNAKPLKVKYTWRVEEELMPVLFEQTFMYYLASQMCITLTEDDTRQVSMYSQYQEHLKRAKAVDSQQTPQDEFADFPLDSARYGSGAGRR